MKYNVGDRVRIKSLDWDNKNKNKKGFVRCGTNVLNLDMCEFCGKIVTIDIANDEEHYYSIVEDEGDWMWTDEMIEGLVEDTTIKIKDLRKFINQMEIEGLNDDTMLVLEIKRSSEHIEKITSMEYSPTTNILIFS